MHFHGAARCSWDYRSQWGLRFIYCSVNAGVDMAFRLPLDGMLIATISVFLVVFISEAQHRVRRENILDALKNENL